MHRLVIIYALIFFPFVLVLAQSRAPLTIQYPIIEEEGSQQNITIYFTVLDSSGPITALSSFSNGALRISDQSYPLMIRDPQTPLRLVLVLDASGSMGPAATTMLNAAKQAVDAAPPATEFYVLQFNNLTRTLTPNFTSDRTAVKASIDDYGGFEPATCLYDATMDALHLFRDQPSETRRAVLLFTDGVDEVLDGGPCSFWTYDEVVATALDATRPVPIYPIGLRGAQRINEAQLEDLATRTGGDFAFGERRDLNNLFRGIVRTLSAQFAAETTVCLPIGEYNGAIELQARGTTMSASIEGLRFRQSCTEGNAVAVVATRIPTTPQPLTLLLRDVSFDAATQNLSFRIAQDGDGSVAQYQVIVRNEETGLPVPGGRFLQPVGLPEVNLRLPEMTGDPLVIIVEALDHNDLPLARVESNRIDPPIPPTATPITASVIITSIDYEPNVFQISLRGSGLENAEGYRVLIEDENGVQVFERIQRTALPNVLQISELEDIDQGVLPSGKYMITVELLVPGMVNQPQAQREIGKEDPPTPTFIDRILQNPVILGALVLLVLGIMLLLVWLIRESREKNSDINLPDFDSLERSNSIDLDDSSELSDNMGSRDTVLIDESDFPRIEENGLTAVLTATRVADIPVGFQWQVTAPFTIGRAGSNNPVDVPIADRSVSKQHTRIEYRNETYRIVDLNSGNGTYVNGERLEGPYNVPIGRPITLVCGKARFQLQVHQDISVDMPLGEHLEPPNLFYTVVDEPVLPLPTTVQAVFTALNLPHNHVDNEIRLSQTNVIVGRAQRCDIVVDTPRVSGKHLRFFFADNRFYLEDLQSTNGTWVDEKRLAPRSPLLLAPRQVVRLRFGVSQQDPSEDLTATFHYTVDPSSSATLLDVDEKGEIANVNEDTWLDEDE